MVFLLMGKVGIGHISKNEQKDLIHNGTNSGYLSMIFSIALSYL